MKFFLVLFVTSLIFAEVNSQTTPKRITLYYDTSYGMRHKDFKKEFDYLDLYFKKHLNVDVILIKFSNTIVLQESYSISDGNWSVLKDELKNTIYDGSASFKSIIDTDLDEILLFTDGNETIDDLPLGFLKPVYIISSVSNSNTKGLKELALSSRGKFINLRQVENDMSDTIIVKGVVKDIKGLLLGVTILSRENNIRVVTNSDGAYKIEAKKGGVLEFSFIGKNTLITRVPISGSKNITLVDGNEILDEVIIKVNSNDEETEYINTGNNIVDKKSLGYAIETISDKEISELDTNIREAVSGQFSNIHVKSNQDLSQFVSRGKNMTMLGNQYGLLVLDGVPLNRSNSSHFSLGGGTVAPTDFINPDNVASITVLKGLAATNKWGTLGRNGVILITTKTAAGSIGKSKKKIKLGTTPTYTGDVLSIKNLSNTPYINALKNSKDIDEAYSIYLAQRKLYGNDIDFFMNVANYFKDWNNPIMLSRIISNIAEFAMDNPNILRAQAYKYEEFGMQNEAVRIYERILKLYPSETQSYRNLVLAYQNAGMYKKALDMYNKIDKNELTLVSNFSGLKKTINNEFKNFVALHKSKLYITSINPFYLNNIEYYTRIVFEWNDYDAEFDLQIVNPQNRYFIWSHTQNGEPVRFKKEKQQGYGLEEFFITKDDKGLWLFNLTYYGKRRNLNNFTSYLKITIYKNFGKVSQVKQIKVVPLIELNKKENVISLKI